MMEFLQRLHWRRLGSVRPCPVRGGAGLAAAAISLTALPLAAQTSPAVVDSSFPRLCHVYSLKDASEGGHLVRANCWGTGVDLGAAVEFEFAVNPALEATIVELVRDGDRRVVLLRPLPTGLPLLEDISGDLAASAGRGPWTGLGSLQVDSSRFADEGVLEVFSAGLAGVPASRTDLTLETGFAAQGELQVAQLIADDSARLRAAAETQ